MKKLLKISLVSMLVAMPMIAGAEPVAGEPVAGNADSPTATNAPKYALKDAGAGDEKAALASYVKGAYNAVIKGINNTQDEINTLNSGIETYSDAIGHLTDGKATQDGTVATIKSATTNESIATSSVNFTGVTTTSISATASGNVNLSVPRMADWETDSLAENPIETTASFTNLPVENLAMSAPTSNTATLTKTGITGNVDVVEYLARMAPAFDFTTLINVNGGDYAYKSAIYPEGSNGGDNSGLSNGEWKVVLGKYGTAKGIGQCSSRSATNSWVGTDNDYVLQSNGTTSTLPDAEGEYCWCKMTGWTPNGGTETPMSSLWVFNLKYGSASACAGYCAIRCGITVRNSSGLRSALFGSVQ